MSYYEVNVQILYKKINLRKKKGLKGHILLHQSQPPDI